MITMQMSTKLVMTNTETERDFHCLQFQDTRVMLRFLFLLFHYYRSDTVNLNTVNSKFHFIQSFCEVSVKCFPIISCLKCTVNSNFHLIRSKTLPMNDFELTMPDL